MSSRPVAVFDSGIGGLPYLSWLHEHLPDEALVFVADNAFFPYGEKSPEQVRKNVVNLGLAIVERFDPKLLLVACNTASVLALDALRQHLSVPVVGVVPAVKPAAGWGSGILAVLATPRTVENQYWERLGKEFAPGRIVKGYAAPDLVRLVEEGGDKDTLVKNWAKKLQSDGADSVVLGCTHYLHLADDLARELGPSVRVVDSRDGVGRRVEAVLRERGLLSEVRTQADLLFYTSNGRSSDAEGEILFERYGAWSRRFGLQFGGPWVLDRTEVTS